MVGHKATYGMDCVMRVVWIGRREGPAMEVRLIDSCWYRFGFMGDGKGGRCLNVARGAGGLSKTKYLCIYIYM